MHQPWDVNIGIVTAPFGRFGEVKVMPLTDFPERFELLKTICLHTPETGEVFLEVEKVRHHKGIVLLKLRGIDSIDDAETLRGRQVMIRESDRLELPKGSYYVDDIIGVEVVTTTGESLGSIREVLRSGANDVYVTEKAMIPAVRQIVKTIDMTKKQMVVEPMEGLLI